MDENMHLQFSYHTWMPTNTFVTLGNYLRTSESSADKYCQIRICFTFDNNAFKKFVK